MVIITIIHWARTSFPVLLILQKWKARICEAEQLPPGHRAGQRWSWDLNKDLSDSWRLWPSHWWQRMQRKWMLSVAAFFSCQESELSRKGKNAMSRWYICDGGRRYLSYPELSSVSQGQWTTPLHPDSFLQDHQTADSDLGRTVEIRKIE